MPVYDDPPEADSSLMNNSARALVMTTMKSQAPAPPTGSYEATSNGRSFNPHNILLLGNMIANGEASLLIRASSIVISTACRTADGVNYSILEANVFRYTRTRTDKAKRIREEPISLETANLAHATLYNDAWATAGTVR